MGEYREEGRRQRAEGRRFAIQCGLQTHTDCKTPNQRFWSGASTLVPFSARRYANGHSRGKESKFPSAFCLLPSAFLAKQFRQIGIQCLWVAVSMELATQRDSEEVVRGIR